MKTTKDLSKSKTRIDIDESFEMPDDNTVLSYHKKMIACSIMVTFVGMCGLLTALLYGLLAWYGKEAIPFYQKVDDMNPVTFCIISMAVLGFSSCWIVWKKIKDL